MMMSDFNEAQQAVIELLRVEIAMLQEHRDELLRFIDNKISPPDDGGAQMTDMIERVRQWARDRNLIEGSTPAKQYLINQVFVKESDINDKIDLWHDGENEVSLPEFLGMTDSEYASFVAGSVKEGDL